MRTFTNLFSVPAVVLILLITVSAQVSPKPQPAKKASQPQPTKPEAQQEADQQDRDALKIGTTLVTVPVIASDRKGIYIPDMRKDDFTLFEDDVEQELVFFAKIDEPFHVILMLDTSASTQEKLGLIQRAAIAFVGQLQPADRVKVISFDDDIRDLNDFTSDRAVLRGAIQKVRPGNGTRLYDAFRLALQNLKYEEGRKAIVLFTDGVDWHSNSTKYDDNTRELEESGVIVYPIRYDTRAETEALVRQQRQGGRPEDLGVIFGDPTRTPPTVPGGDPPPGGRTENRGPYGLPIPPVMIPQPRRTPYPGGGGGRYPDDRYPDPSNPPGGRLPEGRYPDTRRNPIPESRGPRDDGISAMLNHVYEEADRYLNDVASTSGGKLHRADTLVSLPDAFARIAAELRTQYALGYYPANTLPDGTYRKIQVRTSRKDVVIRARPGYRAAANARRK